MLKTLFRCDACMGEGSWMGHDCTDCHGKGYNIDPMDIFIIAVAIAIFTFSIGALL